MSTNVFDQDTNNPGICVQPSRLAEDVNLAAPLVTMSAWCT